MTVCLLILLWIRDELSFDRFHENADRIYRVVKEDRESTGEIDKSAVTSWPLGPALVKDYPEIIQQTRFYNLSRRLISYKSGNKSFYENGVCVADPAFLEIFSFPFVKGDPASALAEPNTVVISEKIIKKYFGDENPMGKILTNNNRTDFMVTGVIKIPRNSHLRFDFLLPFEPTLNKTAWQGSWNISDFHTFLLLGKNVVRKELEGKIYPYLSERFAEYNVKTKLRLQALTDLHLRSDYNYDIYGASKDLSIYIYAFSIIAVFILFIACINFINLTVALSSTRTREVGLRKVVGAKKKDLFIQFFGESVILTVISFGFALAAIYLLLPLFNNLTGKTLVLNPLGKDAQGMFMLLVAVTTGIVAGIYPAAVQSSLRPAHILKSQTLSVAGKGKSFLFRRALVILQFTCSIALIIGTLVINNQFRYLRNKNLGYKKDQIIYFTQRGEIRGKFGAFKEALLKNPNVSSITTSSDILTQTHHSTTRSFEWEGMQPDANRFSLYQFSVDPDYIKTFNMTLKEGRNFSKKRGTDKKGTAYILNEAAVKTMGLQNPVGKWFKFWGDKGIIIGIVKDYHFKSLHSEVEPMILRIDDEWNWYVCLKIRAGQISRTLNEIEEVYQRFNPRFPFEFHFLDESLDRLYDSEKQTYQVFQSFTSIAILISCLGLFGLAAFTAKRRTKEIGIRKVIGASAGNIIVMLSKEFLILTAAANIIAWPVAYFAMNRWLQNFAYRSSVGLVIFIVSGCAALIIAFGAVLFQSIKAAHTDPVAALRYE
jgi:ABC-type antimicrobial peptide transport system permease subunit